MTTETNTTTKQSKNCSDLLRWLECLKRLFEAMLDTQGSLSYQYLMFALTVETELLNMKLSQMEIRWRCHLPFTEAFDVDFKHWGEVVGVWRDIMDYHHRPEVRYDYNIFKPDDSFYIDYCKLLASPKEESMNYAEMSVSDYLKLQKSLLTDYDERRRFYKKTIQQNCYKNLCLDETEIHKFIFKNAFPDISLNKEFYRLSKVLYNIDAILQQEHTFSVYADYYTRIILTYFSTENSRASATVKEWCRCQKKTDLSLEAKVQIRLLSAELAKIHPFEDINRTVDFNELISQQYAALGRYIFEHRKVLLPMSGSTTSYYHNLSDAVFNLICIELYQKVEQADYNCDNPQMPVQSPLTHCFTTKLRSNPKATRKFISILREKQKIVSNRQREANGALRWGHIYEAIKTEKTEIMFSDTTPTEFGRAMEALLDGVSGKNIARYSQNDRYNKDGAGKGIIESLVTEFMSIWT